MRWLSGVRALNTGCCGIRASGVFGLGNVEELDAVLDRVLGVVGVREGIAESNGGTGGGVAFEVGGIDGNGDLSVGIELIAASLVWRLWIFLLSESIFDVSFFFSFNILRRDNEIRAISKVYSKARLRTQ